MIFIFFLFMIFYANANADANVSWQEEVKLSDDRVIVVGQKKQCEGALPFFRVTTCVVRETWMTFRLPEFSENSILWHENLDPIILNVADGDLYVIALGHDPNTFLQYGVKTYYIGFKWNEGKWNLIDFKTIPEKIYDSNLLLQAVPNPYKKYIKLQDKESATQGVMREIRRVDPKFNPNPY